MGRVTTVSRAEGFTRADLDAMPDDGRRHELIDGVIIVTPFSVMLLLRLNWIRGCSAVLASSLASSTSMKSPRRLTLAANSESAVSYTHLTLPTKRIV